MMMVGQIASINVDPNNPNSEHVPVLKCELPQGTRVLPLIPSDDNVHNQLLISLRGDKKRSLGAVGELKGSDGQPYMEVTKLYE